VVVEVVIEVVAAEEDDGSRAALSCEVIGSSIADIQTSNSSPAYSHAHGAHQAALVRSAVGAHRASPADRVLRSNSGRLRYPCR